MAACAYQDNPTDYASRGGMLTEGNQLWWKGPTWLADPINWPPDIVTTPTTESNAEVKPTKELFALAVDVNDELDDLLSKTSYWRTLRVCAWIRRFIDNEKKAKLQRINRPLTTEEIKNQELFWVRRVQARGAKGMEEDRLTLNLQKNDDGLLECRGRLQGDYPIYIPDSTILAEKIVQQAHNATLHRGVGLTMARIRERFWISRLRRLVKRTVKKCYGCKRFQAVALANPPPGLLPQERTKAAGVFVSGFRQAYQVQQVFTARKESPLGFVCLQPDKSPVPKRFAEPGD